MSQMNKEEIEELSRYIIEKFRAKECLPHEVLSFLISCLLSAIWASTQEKDSFKNAVYKICSLMIEKASNGPGGDLCQK